MALEKKYVWMIAAGTAVLACAGGLVIGLPIYKSWQAKRLIQSAKAAAERGSYLDASLNLRHVLDLAPNDSTAHAMLADLAERAGDPSAVLWRKRIAELSNGDSSALIAYAAVATRFNQRAAAREALDRVPEPERSGLAYQSAAGALAYLNRAYSESALYYTNAVRLAPQDEGLQFALALAELGVNELETRDLGRNRLRALAHSPDWQVKAIRALISDLSAHGEVMAALREARQLTTFPKHEFSDELLMLSLLRAAEEPDLRTKLTELQGKAVENSANARDLLTWMAESGLAKAGIEWATVQEPDLSKKPELQAPLAACYVASEDWPTVLTMTQGADWGNLEYVRHVYRSRALRERGELSLALSDWKIAATAAASRSEAILWLAKTAEKWDWPEETEQALWAAVERGADSDWALETLRLRYAKARNSNGLRRVAGQMLKANPNDLDSQNNFAALCLLLNKETERAIRLARETFQKNPTHPDYVSTYAYALFRQGDVEGAVKLLEEHLPASKLSEPAYAAYYGLLLQGVGRNVDALKYLRLARSGSLLAEEEQFVNAALAKLDSDLSQAPQGETAAVTHENSETSSAAEPAAR